jgi:mannose-6-phosphate isomerase-like protein (cupin superfamily)
MSVKSEYQKIQPYTTKDGSEIRELMHPNFHGSKNQSLAEATVSPGHTTFMHSHFASDEIYHITHGTGLLFLGDEEIEVHEGDTIYIPHGTPHKIANTGNVSLKILCCSSPPYSHDDTTLIG